MYDQVITGSRARAGLLLAGLMILSPLMIWVMLADTGSTTYTPERGAIYAVLLGLFALVAGVALAAQLVDPPRLRLTPQALVIEGALRRPRTLAWGDIAQFVVVRAFGSESLGFLCMPGRGPSGRPPRRGIDGSLGGAWPCSASQLAEQLSSYRAWALAQGQRA